MTSPSYRCAVLGSPITHSLSPTLHRAAYAELGLDWTYDAVEVTEPQLPGFLDALDGSWRGLSLTMPLKRSVVPLLDELSDRARQAGAANTVVLEGNRRIGHNTDIGGAATAIRERYDGALDRAVVLGGGATAASVILALADLGCSQATVLVRDPLRARTTLEAVARHRRPPEVAVARLGEPIAWGDAEILVSTIPASAQTEDVRRLATVARVVFEVLYEPWPTPLAISALQRGVALVSGLDLLVHQAARQVELMTGCREAPVEAMRVAGEQALAERSGLPGPGSEVVDGTETTR